MTTSGSSHNNTASRKEFGTGILPFIIILITLSICLKTSICRADFFIVADSGSVDFGYVYASDLMKGFKEIGASSLDYAQKITIIDTETLNWEITARATTPEFVSIAGHKACGHLEWRLNGTGNYTPFTTNENIVDSGSGDGAVEIDYRVKTDWTDKPGSYSITIVYTLAEAI